MRIRTRAAELAPGDLLLGSGTTILAQPARRGDRVIMAVQRRNGTVTMVNWNARTTMTVER